MKVEVRTFANLCAYTGSKTGEPFTVTLPDNATLGGLLKTIGIPEKEVKLTIVNGRLVEKDTPLKEKDRVAIFPPLAGG